MVVIMLVLFTHARTDRDRTRDRGRKAKSNPLFIAATAVISFLYLLIRLTGDFELLDLAAGGLRQLHRLTCTDAEYCGEADGGDMSVKVTTEVLMPSNSRGNRRKSVVAVEVAHDEGRSRSRRWW